MRQKLFNVDVDNDRQSRRIVVGYDDPQGSQTLLGIPVVVTDSAPKGEALFGRFPTQHELDEMSRLMRKPYTIHEWIKDNPTKFAKVTGIKE